MTATRIDGLCAAHPEVPAAFVCPRCGDFGCEACAHRVVAGAEPLCPACWKLRAAHAEELERGDRRHLSHVALGLGILALVPCIWPIQLAAPIVAAVAWRRAHARGDAKGVTMAAVGLALSVLGVAGTIAVVSFGLYP